MIADATFPEYLPLQRGLNKELSIRSLKPWAMLHCDVSFSVIVVQSVKRCALRSTSPSFLVRLFSMCLYPQVDRR